MSNTDSFAKQVEDCNFKRIFKSRKMARTHAERATAKYKFRMYFYKCSICGDFHLTKSKPRKNNQK